MDDLMNMVGQIMSDPEQMKQIASLASSLGISMPEETQTEAADSLAEAAEEPLSSQKSDTLSSLLPLMQKLQGGNDDKYITFLRSMQPLLSDSRRPKVDTAILIFKLFAFLPYLEETGLLPHNHTLDTIQKFLKGFFP